MHNPGIAKLGQKDKKALQTISLPESLYENVQYANSQGISTEWTEGFK